MSETLNIQECFVERFDTELGADVVEDMLEIKGAPEVKSAIKKAAKMNDAGKIKGEGGPVPYIFGILRSEGKKRKVNTERESTFRYIYDPLKADGVITDTEYQLIEGKWLYGREIPEELRPELNCKIRRHHQPDNPATWFPCYGLWERNAAVKIAQDLIADGLEPTWEHFADVSAAARILQEETAKNAPPREPIKQLIREIGA